MPRAYLFGAISTLREDPAQLNSADAELIVTCDDSMDYVVKTIQKNPATPAAEWISHNIADACNIPTPQFTLVKLNDGRVGFGSQWDASIVDLAQRNEIAMAVPGSSQLAAQFSAIYALDLFLHNDDRHFGNYLFVKTSRGLGVKAYDFSRALLYQGWPIPDLPLPVSCHTQSVYKALRVGYPYVESIGDQVIQRLRNIKAEHLDGWIKEMPADWLSSSARAELVNWWDVGAKARLSIVEKGLRNGSFF